MKPSPQKFAELLTAAITMIKARTGQPIAVIQDEVGYALGRQGGSYIPYLRKAHLPTSLADAEQLAHELMQRGGLDGAHCEQLLASAGHPQARQLTQHWFNGDATHKASGSTTMHVAAAHKPFVAGPPILQPRQFFGRDYELRRIFGVWQALPLEHIALVGKRRSGKTSLLHHLHQITQIHADKLRPRQRTDWLPNPTEHRWIFVDFQDPRMRTPTSLFRHLLTGFGLPAPDPCNLDTFVERVIDRPTPTPTVILLDELEAGLSAPTLDQAFWWGLRALVNATSGGSLAFVVAAHESPLKLAADCGQTSPFFNMFNGLEVGPLTEPEARELVASAPIEFDPADIAWILAESGRWPYVVQMLCQERLSALENGETDERWKENGVRRRTPFQYLLAA